MALFTSGLCVLYRLDGAASEDHFRDATSSIQNAE